MGNLIGKEAAEYLGISFTTWNYTVHLLGIKSNGGFTKEQIEEVREFRSLPSNDPRKSAIYSKYKKHQETIKHNIPTTTLAGKFLQEKYNSIYARADHTQEYQRLYARERKLKPANMEEFKQTCPDEVWYDKKKEKKEKVEKTFKTAKEFSVRSIAKPYTEYITFDPTFVFGQELKQEYDRLIEEWSPVSHEDRYEAKYEATAYILCKYHFWDRDDYFAFKNTRWTIRAHKEVKIFD